MKDQLHSIAWKDKTVKLDELLCHSRLRFETMNQGNEAEVTKISTESESFVLKSWNLDSKPNIRFQYNLLNALSAHEITVSEAIGWGVNAEGNHVLLTTFDGEPIRRFNREMLTKTALVLVDLHKIPTKALDVTMPTYNFIDYFYHPEIEKYPDIHEVIKALLEKVQVQQNCVIHGDFHFENIVEKNGKYAIIDWTNGQLGDQRYDFAWSYTLLRIYSPSDWESTMFRSVYFKENQLDEEEIEIFEALACLRWIFLNRNKSVPIRRDTIKRVKRVLRNNPYLAKISI
ncbi:aminoglycoside phosphotransferase [Virgibacillus phasianinus]|uniref:Aminoglycoside phosphotransferase n=1 Tax=Virgibacillus phasianinus TaxID=2017483 RepID=A0A220U1C8_9BACI|nr:aminoglycoside phosphotransferase family protein [Virgibacillus phasianinus]ASK61909.1 aminoglycoside phosphotransferase [Virgibacillus phasianinus]